MRRVSIKMTDWIEKLHGFLSLNDREILTHAGRVSAQVAKDIAELEYEKFNQQRIHRPTLNPQTLTEPSSPSRTQGADRQKTIQSKRCPGPLPAALRLANER
jgi:Virulence protein RhuM family